MNVLAAERMGRLKYAIRNIAMAAMKLESQGRKIIYLNIGDPLLYDFATPPALVEAVILAMRDGKNYYAPSHGVLQAREAIAGALERQRVDVAPGNVFITSGASEGIEVALTAMLEPGDNVLTPVPGYPLYNAVFTKLHVEGRGYRLLPRERWRPDLEQAESLIDRRTRGLVIINPNNPTGAVWGEETLLKVIDLARRHRLVLLADEVYHDFTYVTRPPRIASLASDVPIIAFDSLSKAYLATGWRCGWMTLHGSPLMGEIKGAIGRLLDARLCSPVGPQFAIPEALEGDRTHVEEAHHRLRERRAVTVERLSAIPGFRCEPPDAAFYIMAQFSGLGGRSDEEFVLDVLNNAGVLMVHGSGFGMAAEDGYMRIVFLPPVPVLEAAYAGIASVAEEWINRSRVS